ncbi:MAG: gluconate 2-dehydrogenase subunit 3 family protein [Gammaproteobacteria bacterium]|nr:gluconate 2-dehydrogenase subunit 3 family protein [Gammaproteobacteria bacterium]
MKQRQMSRRAFLNAGGDAAKGSCIILTMPMILTACGQANDARTSNNDFQLLSEEEVLEYSAISARIIPSNGTPGATEAGVIYFIDSVVADNREVEHQILKDGLVTLQSEGAAQFGVASFYLLKDEQQDQLLRQIESSEFFNTIRFLTVAGMFSSPEYGGNRDKVGFELLGFTDQHAWQPPFGFYDADYAEKGE